MTKYEDVNTHHLVPKAGVPKCRYCGLTRSELAAQHNNQDVTQYACPKHPARAL